MEAFLCFIVLNAAFHATEECSPVSRLDNQNQELRTALSMAEQGSVDGRIVLGIDEQAMPLAGGSPICSGPAQPLTLVRARLRETAVFTCPLDRCLSGNATCLEFDKLIWKHENYSVWHVLCKGRFSPFVYSQTRTSTNAYLHIHNITGHTFGSVYCYCQLPAGGYCINQAYELWPVLISSDVFEAPVLNVTRPAGTNVTLLSKLRIRMTKHMNHRYIVRYNGRIIWAPPSHPLHTLAEAVFPHGVDFSPSEDNIIITIADPPKSFSGKFEVWVRPYMIEDEFVVQTINLNLT